MSRTSVKRRTAPAMEKPAAPLAPPPTREEFEAECAALTAAVAETLEPRTKPKAPKLAAAPVVSGAGPNKGDPAGPQPIDYPGEMEFVPPYSFILSHAGAGAKGGDGTGDVTISRQLLEFLLRCVLDRTGFDEQQYQKCNPDVAAAIKQRKMHSGREHFVKTGYFEGRSGGVHVDEAWYLARNPDVAAAKKAGKFESAADQYRLSGASEWRVPNPRSEDAVRLWRNVLGR
jgi:hypothetical protein